MEGRYSCIDTCFSVSCCSRAPRPFANRQRPRVETHELPASHQELSGRLISAMVKWADCGEACVEKFRLPCPEHDCESAKCADRFRSSLRYCMYGFEVAGRTTDACRAVCAQRAFAFKVSVRGRLAFEKRAYSDAVAEHESRADSDQVAESKAAADRRRNFRAGLRPWHSKIVGELKR
jgi:hypothetical protein